MCSDRAVKFGGPAGHFDSLRSLGEAIKDKAVEVALDDIMDQYVIGGMVSMVILPPILVAHGFAKTGSFEREQQAEFERDFAFIPALFDRFDTDERRPEGTRTQAKQNYLATSLAADDSHANDYQKALTATSRWEGEAVDSFNNNHLIPMANIPSNQQNIVIEILSCLETHKLLVATSANFMEELGQATLASLTEHGVSKDVATPFIDIGLTVTEFWMSKKAPKTGKDKASLVISTLNHARTVDDMMTLAATISGDSAHEIIESMKNAVSTLEASIEDEERKLVNRIEQCAQEIEDFLDGDRHGSEPNLRPMLPDIVTFDELPLDEFYPDDS